MNGSRPDGRDRRSEREVYSSRGERGDRDERRGGGDRERRDRDRDHGGRRRSRSPHRSRREFEVDSYSSSRDYREREREDRYAGRDAGRERPNDRGGWDRDRGGRRDDDRPPRRERGDLFDDRRRGGGRPDRDNRRGGEEARQEAAPSPPRKKKEPTPDLTDVIPILERKRRLTQWDIKPPGYENVTAEQAKLSGMFPLPGAPRQQPMDPSKLQAFMNQPGNEVSASALKPSNAKQSKRLFAYNVPAGSSEASVTEFFNLQLNGLNVVSGVDPCISTQIARDGNYALLEFKSSEDATMALALDGISMTDDSTNGATNGHSSGFSIKRPSDYIAPAVNEISDYMEGALSSVVGDSANKISVTQIPLTLDDAQVKELLSTFGELKAFVLVKDRSTEESRGIAFCEYAESSNTDVAVEGLNGMELGSGALRVTRASIGVQQASGLEMGVNAMSMLASASAGEEGSHGRVLQLLNMVTAEELLDADEYEEIVEDVKEECDKFGHVLEIKVPRPTGASRQSAGVGKIFVKYERNEDAEKALKSLAGRKFADRTVVCTYYGEEYFDVNAW